MYVQFILKRKGPVMSLLPLLQASLVKGLAVCLFLGKITLIRLPTNLSPPHTAFPY